MSVISKAKVGALRTAEFAAETALNVGILGFEGTRLTGAGIRRVGEALETVGILGTASCQARINQLNHDVDALCQEIQGWAEAAEAKRNAEASGEAEPEVVMV
jgi:hypothetical protein